MKFLSNLMSLLVNSGRLVLMLPSLIIVFALITFFCFPGTWNAAMTTVVTQSLQAPSGEVRPEVLAPVTDEPGAVENASSQNALLSADGKTVTPRAWTYLLVLAFTLVWPVAMVPVMRMIVKQERNAYNLLGLAVLAAVPAAMMLAVVWPGISSAVTLLGFCLYTVAAFVWTGTIMNRVAEG